MQIKPMARVVLTLMGITVMGAAQAAGPAIGDPAPAFEARTLSGESFRLDDFKGKKPVYLKFWATWCHYCKAEMPHLKSLRDTYGEEVEVVTINVGLNDSISNVEYFFKQQGYQLPTIFDQQGALTSMYGVVGTPHHVLIDRDGNVAHRTFLANDTLDQLVESWATHNRQSAGGVK